MKSKEKHKDAQSGSQSKKAKTALQGTSLPAPSQLVGEPPATGLCVGDSSKGAQKKGSNWWVSAQFEVVTVAGRQKYKCVHAGCGRLLTGSQKQRLKEHLLNTSACKFLDSAAAAELSSTVPAVKEALKAIAPTAGEQRQFQTTLLQSQGVYQVCFSCVRCVLSCVNRCIRGCSSS